MDITFKREEVEDIMKRHVIWLAEKNIDDKTIKVYKHDGTPLDDITVEVKEIT